MRYQISYTHLSCLFCVVILTLVHTTPILADVDPVTGEPLSQTFSVTVNGQAVSVIRYEDIDYVQAPVCCNAQIAITRLDGQAIENYRVRPDRFGITGTVTDNQLTLTLNQHGQLVVNIGLMRKLILLLEPPASDRPRPGDTGLINIMTYNVDPTGTLDNTALIQQAINELPSNGVLYFPAGRYLTGSLDLKSNMTLYVDDQAIIKGTSDHTKHLFNGSYLYFLRGENLTNVKILGQGTIDANGEVVRTLWEAIKGQKVPGRIFLMIGCQNLNVNGMIFRDSYSWNMHLVTCDNVEIQNVKILSSMSHSNGDGLDLDGCIDVFVDNCLFYAWDDAISLKAAWSSRSPLNNTVRNCVLWSQMATGIRLGTESHSTAFSNFLFENIDILRANTMIRIFDYQGADIHDLIFRNMWFDEYSLYAHELGYDEVDSGDVTAGETYLMLTLISQTSSYPVGKVHDILLEKIHTSVMVGSKFYGIDPGDGSKTVYDNTIHNLYCAGVLITTAEDAHIRGNDFGEIPTIEYSGQ